MILLSVCSLVFSKPLSSCWFPLPVFSCSYSTSYLLSACVKIFLLTFFYVLCEEHSSLYANVSYTKELVLDVVKETCFKYNKNQTWVFQSCWHPTTVFLFPIKACIDNHHWQLQAHCYMKCKVNTTAEIVFNHILHKIVYPFLVQFLILCSQWGAQGSVTGMRFILSSSMWNGFMWRF